MFAHSLVRRITLLFAAVCLLGATCATMASAHSVGHKRSAARWTMNGVAPAKSAHAAKAKTSKNRARSITPSKPVTPSKTVTNSFGSGIFGIAAGGSLQNEDATTLGHDLNMDSAAGARWLRVDINWAQIQQGGPTSYDWSSVDAVVAGARSRGMNVLGTILYTPTWAGASVISAPAPAAYATFAAAAARHYEAMGVNAFEIWNEPNTSAFWQNPSPAAYTRVLKAAYPAIKSADPSATVITAGLAPSPTDGTNYSPVDFLSGIYAAGGQGSFDAVGAHPYCAPDYPGNTDSWSAWYQMYGTPTSMRSLMIAHGDGAKKIWATEYGAPTAGPASEGVVTKAVQAAMVTRAYRVWSTYSWGGPLFMYQGRDQGTDTGTSQNFYGFINNNFTPKPSYLAYKAAAQTI
jgi:polysaccharide biosynthesis protein PslG